MAKTGAQSGGLLAHVFADIIMRPSSYHGVDNLIEILVDLSPNQTQVTPDPCLGISEV